MRYCIYIPLSYVLMAVSAAACGVAKGAALIAHDSFDMTSSLRDWAKRG
jgi:hypothetical protein